jgi:hypothetical protein
LLLEPPGHDFKKINENYILPCHFDKLGLKFELDLINRLVVLISAERHWERCILNRKEESRLMNTLEIGESRKFPHFH